MVKGHPAYSGTIMTATFQMVRELGWEYLEKLVKAARDAGAVVDRSAEEAVARRARRDGRRQRIRHRAVEGSRPAGRAGLSGRGHADDLRADRHLCKPRRIPMPQNCSRPGCIRGETQQFFIDFTAQYSVHAQVQSKPGRRKISDIKLMKEDADRRREDDGRDQDALCAAVSGVRMRVRHTHRRHSGMVRRTQTQMRNCHRGISRFRVRCFASPRNDGEKDRHDHHHHRHPKIPHRLDQAGAVAVRGLS